MNRANIPTDVIKLVAKQLKPHYRRNRARRYHEIFKVGWIYDVIHNEHYGVEAKVQTLGRLVTKSGKVAIEYSVSHGRYTQTGRANVKTEEGAEGMQVRIDMDDQHSLGASGFPHNSRPAWSWRGAANQRRGCQKTRVSSKLLDMD